MKSLYAFITAAALACAPAAFAADAPAGNTIAVVNIQQIMRDAAAAKTVRDQLDAKQKAFQAELSKKEEALQKEDQDLGKERGVLSKEAFDKKAEAFRKKVTDGQKEAQSKKAMLDAAYERAVNDVQKAVTDIITDMAKEKGFIVAIPTSQTLYFDAKLDITNDVLSRLNQKMPKLDAKFDAPAAPADKK